MGKMPMRTIRRTVAATLVAALALAGCQSAGDGSTGNSATTGALLGGIAGAAAGSQFGSGQGGLVAVLVGAVIGAVAGGAIGSALDEADRQKADAAARQAANAPSPGRVHWQSESNQGVVGYAEPVTPAALEDGNLCKQVQSLYYLNGEQKTESKRFCLQAGRWVEA